MSRNSESGQIPTVEPGITTDFTTEKNQPRGTCTPYVVREHFYS